MSNDSSKQAISDDGRYMALTRDIRVLVDPAYLEERSDPDAHQFVWAYTIEIRNEGQKTVQLKERYWKIIDANGKVEHVRGSGVVGEQPVIKTQKRSAFSANTLCQMFSELYALAGVAIMILAPTISLRAPGPNGPENPSARYPKRPL